MHQFVLYFSLNWSCRSMAFYKTLLSMFFVHPFVNLFIYRGIGGATPIGDPGPGVPRSTCFCWLFCISSMLARSVSKIIGAKRTMLLVKKIHEEAQANLYTATTDLAERSMTPSVNLRAGSGNISVSPHNRSQNVSSGSCKGMYVGLSYTRLW